jgi:molybdenum cofactor synthesis domain-containing protein
MTTALRIAKTARAIIIGAEILSGKVKDTNSHALALTLRQLGVQLCGIETIGDSVEEIAAAVDRARAQADIVITSGGIGPTHDDKTVEGVAQAHGVGIVILPGLVELLRGHYREAYGSVHAGMARAPEGTELLASEDHAWPILVKDRIWMFPGVPELFRMKLLVLRRHIIGPSSFYHESLFLRVEETEVKEALDTVSRAYPDVEVGSYPKWFNPAHKTQITFDGRDLEQVQLACTSFRDGLPAGWFASDH